MNQEPAVGKIPNKLFFRIGEVSKLVGVEPHVLRFWETEFRSLTPKKTDTGHRLFRRKDVELLFHIKDLLYNKRFTIEGARQTLQQERRSKLVKPTEAQQALFPSDPLPQIREELVALLQLLSH